MKIKLVITAMLFILFSTLRAQDVILGEKNPCPEETYEYIFNGISCDGNLTWSVNHGTVIQTTSNRIKISWHKDFVGNGSWHVRAHFSRQKSDGSCDVSSYHELPIKVNAVSSFNIIGDREIPGGFRGTKTYTAQIKNTLFPATSYLWTVYSGGTTTNYTTTIPSFNLNITDDGPKWISVQGKNSTCSSWGQSIKADIFTTTTFTGPSSICDEGTYTLINPGTVTLENAAGIATLTALGNNQWKVMRIGSAEGTVYLKSSIGVNIYNFPIEINSEMKGTMTGPGGIKQGMSGTITFTPLTGNNYTNLAWTVDAGAHTSLQIDPYNLKITIPPNYPLYDTYNGDDIIVTVKANGECGLMEKNYVLRILPRQPSPNPQQ